MGLSQKNALEMVEKGQQDPSPLDNDHVRIWRIFQDGQWHSLAEIPEINPSTLNVRLGEIKKWVTKGWVPGFLDFRRRKAGKKSEYRFCQLDTPEDDLDQDQETWNRIPDISRFNLEEHGEAVPRSDQNCVVQNSAEDKESDSVDLRESLAALAHDQWSGWMRYMIGRLEGPDPKVWIDRWRRQMETPYDKLSENEKESDRKEADRVIEVFQEVWGKADRDTSDPVIEMSRLGDST